MDEARHFKFSTQTDNIQFFPVHQKHTTKERDLTPLLDPSIFSGIGKAIRHFTFGTWTEHWPKDDKNDPKGVTVRAM